MTGNSATVTVDGPAAHQITSNLLANVGMTAADIELATVSATIGEDGPPTEVSIDADGPLAGLVVAQMLSGVKWDEHTATAIDATFEEPEVQTEAEGKDVDDEERESATGWQPHVTPLVEKVNPSTVEFPESKPDRLRENTQIHAVGSLLVEYFGDSGGQWATTEDLVEFADGALSKSQVQSALSGIFTRKGLTVRRQVQNAGTWKYEHVPTKQLSEEIDRLGHYSFD